MTITRNMLRAGQLRHKVTLESRTESRGSAGEVNQTWDAISAVWARVEPLSGRELERAQMLHAEVDYKVTIRHYQFVKAGPDLRVKHILDGTTYYLYVRSVVNPDDHNIVNELYCTRDAT